VRASVIPAHTRSVTGRYLTVLDAVDSNRWYVQVWCTRMQRLAPIAIARTTFAHMQWRAHVHPLHSTERMLMHLLFVVLCNFRRKISRIKRS
jgi:hypothetical protein